ncbi:hypothetical protein SH661x_004468 [Planctomicrobium sp. SH661]|uniref:hypothetical protein n=1 Tax=Planctomicrobium sp. SH661 TaxID=3448124 RepID=UPI003F5C63A5
MTGIDFTKQLNRPLLINRDFVPLRTIAGQLAEARQISILLDRRIDPERLVLVDLQAPFFDSGIASLVADVPAGAVVAGDTVFITTPDSARTLRTRVALAERSLQELPKADLSRQLELSRKVSVQWPDLSSPRQILSDFATRFEITIENPEAIPYDLWAAGTIAHANFVTGALLIASQYELDLDWIDTHRIRLIPQGAHPQIEQEHVFRGRTKQQVSQLLEEKFPELNLQMLSDRLRVTGLLEQQEEIAVLLGNRAPRKAAAPVVATSLANRRFTLRMQNRPFSELIDLLEKQGIHFVRNEQLLSDAEINLNQQISLELQEATIQKLLTDACTPLGLIYQIDGTNIELLPANRAPSEQKAPGNFGVD